MILLNPCTDASSIAQAADNVVAQPKRHRLREHDKFLRQFQYREALSSALSTSNPTVSTTPQMSKVFLCIILSDESCLRFSCGYLAYNVENQVEFENASIFVLASFI